MPRNATRPVLETPIRRSVVNVPATGDAAPVRATSWNMPGPSARKIPLVPSSRTAVNASRPALPFATSSVKPANVPPAGAGKPISATDSSAPAH